jgi:hypothetical protein
VLPLIRRILTSLGLQGPARPKPPPVINPPEDEEGWRRIELSDGRVLWESERGRQERECRAREEAERAAVREATGFVAEDMDGNADRLMEALESCYRFGDPDFDPTIIFTEAARRFGFESDYVGHLVNNLVRRNIVTFEYTRDRSLHPRDVLDHWRLSKPDA